MQMKTSFLTIGALAFAIASGLSVSVASPVPTQVLAPAFIAAGSATAQKTQVEGVYRLAEEEDRQDGPCPPDEHNFGHGCIDMQ
jgi:hypothetical protein